jgi:hypothetical protein
MKIDYYPSNTNAINFVTLSWRRTEGSAAISLFMRLLRRFAPRNDSIGSPWRFAPRDDTLIIESVLMTDKLLNSLFDVPGIYSVFFQQLIRLA